MDHVPDLPVLRSLAVNLLRPLRLPTCGCLHPLSLPEVALCEAHVSIAKKSSLALRYLALIDLPLVFKLIHLQEIAEEHLVEVEVIVDLGVCLLVEIFSRSAEYSVGVTFHVRFLNDSCLALFISHHGSHPLHNSRVEDRVLIVLVCLLEVTE